jgi:hypothetical protein
MRVIVYLCPNKKWRAMILKDQIETLHQRLDTLGRCL